MGRLKTFRKYIIWIVAFYIFSVALIYIGLNATYKNIEQKEDLPNQVNIDVAQATTVSGRIYGEITNKEENNLNGKYIKVQIYNKKQENMGIKYLEIKDLNIDETKKFMVYFKADNIEYYSIEIVENSEELQEEKGMFEELFKNVFQDEEVPLSVVLLTLIWAIA